MHRRFDNFIRILLQTAFTDDGWSYEWGLKQSTFGGELEYLRVLAVFREYMLRALEISTGSTLLDTLSTAHISDVCTAGTACCTRGSVLIILPVTRSISAFSTRTAHIPSTRSSEDTTC